MLLLLLLLLLLLAVVMVVVVVCVCMRASMRACMRLFVFILAGNGSRICIAD